MTNPSPIISTEGLVACHLAADGDDVYAVNYTSGSVIKLPDILVTHSGKGAHPIRQTSAHTHYVNFTPDGKYLFVTDLGLDKIFVYNRDMTPISSVDMPGGDGPRHLSYHKDGKHIFCAGELASTVSVLEYEDGYLKLIDTVSTLPDDFSGENTTAAIRCIGDTVYVSNRGHDSVAVIEFRDGALKLLKTVPTHGSSPRDFIVVDDTVIATNERTDNVTFVCLKTGELIYEISVPAPLCVLKNN